MRRMAIGMRAALCCAAIVSAFAGTGCARWRTGCPGESCTIPAATREQSITCPPGGCKPGEINGRGIYADVGASYCARNLDGLLVCPEAFFNRPDGVTVLYRLSDENVPAQDASIVYEARVGAAVFRQGSANAETVALLSMRAHEGHLLLSFQPATGPMVRDAAVESFVGINLFWDMEVKTPAGGPLIGQGKPTIGMASLLKPVSAPLAPIPAYQLSYQTRTRDPATDTLVTGWAQGCEASFVGGRRVDAVTAEVTDQSEATTMACKTSAIATCLEWGYTPWNPKARDPATSSYLFQTCLQAKRAAYFMGHQDAKSYTKSGTEILIRDPFGIKNDWFADSAVEALWTPRGAECLNQSKRRRPEIPITNDHHTPGCASRDWTTTGKIITAPAPRIGP